MLISLVLQAGGREAETEREKRRIPRRRVNRPIRAGWREHSIYMFKARLIPPCHAGAESRPQVPWPRDDAVSTWDGGEFLADPWGRHEGVEIWSIPILGAATAHNLVLAEHRRSLFRRWDGEGRRGTCLLALQPKQKLAT